jgi:hypothetical protein
MKLSTQEDFDYEVYISQKCHEGAGLHACYVKNAGAFRLECAECGRLIAMIAVAVATSTAH